MLLATKAAAPLCGVGTSVLPMAGCDGPLRAGAVAPSMRLPWRWSGVRPGAGGTPLLPDVGPGPHRHSCIRVKVAGGRFSDARAGRCREFRAPGWGWSAIDSAMIGRVVAGAVRGYLA